MQECAMSSNASVFEERCGGDGLREVKGSCLWYKIDLMKYIQQALNSGKEKRIDAQSVAKKHEIEIGFTKLPEHL